MQGQNTAEPPPAGWGSFLRGTKNDQEIFPEAFWEIPKFFSAREVPRSAPEPIYVDFCGLLGRFCADCVFFDEFWHEKAPKMHPLNLQNHGFHSEGIQNPGFSRFLENTPKRTSRDPPGEAKWRPKSLRGGLKTMKNGPRTFLGPPRPEPVNFFSPPEASRSAPGSIFIASWQPPGAQGVPRGSPEASGSSFWAILVAFLPPFWHRLWDIWRAVLASVVGLRGVTKQQFSVMCDPPALPRKQPQQPKT